MWKYHHTLIHERNGLVVRVSHKFVINLSVVQVGQLALSELCLIGFVSSRVVNNQWN
uniref:Uncharacterized protein n=1 Tax=Schistosoma japonicum TaxID=6182 RepID=Q5BVP8_SCHJA|nr:unknown [Schistosoma japonicum]